MKKRTILAIAIVAGAITLVGPMGLSPAFLIVGVVLAVSVYNKGDKVVVGAIQKGYVTVHEIRQKKKTTDELVSPNAPTVPLEQTPLTGHFREAPEPAVPPTPIEEAPAPAFVIGTTEDGRTIELDEITSLGVAGVPGSGKTVAMTGLSAQAVVKYQGDVRFLLVDPHMLTGSDDALSSRMTPLAPFYLHAAGLPNPVFGGADLLKWIKWLTQQAKDRIGGRVPRDQQVKIVLMADEFTALMDDPEIGPALTELLLLINEQSRKVGIFALVASPSWKSSRISGTDVRNTIASFLVHNMPPAIARMLIPSTEAERSNTLAKGQAIFSSFGQVETVRVPFRSQADIARCVQPYLPRKSETGLDRGIVVHDITGQVVVDSADLPIPEPSIAEIRSIWETYQILNRDLSYSEDSAIRALAIDVYGPGDPLGVEKVRRALKLGEEHL